MNIVDGINFVQLVILSLPSFRVYVRSVRKNLVAIGLEMKDLVISLKWFTMESSKFVVSITDSHIISINLTDY